MSFSAIAAIGKNRELGKNGKLIWRLPKDLQYFKKTTLGKGVLMGRKTFDSIPGGKGLPGRENYVLSSKPHQDMPSVTFISSLSDFVKDHQGDSTEIFVIGGGMVYWEMLKHCDKLYLTEVDAEDKDADTFFPNFSRNQYKRVEIGRGEDNGISFTFSRYDKIK